MVLALAAARIKQRQAQPERRPLYAHQIPPPLPWAIWLLLGGRGAGKTEAGARYIDGHAKGPACLDGHTPHRMAIVAPSHDDAVNTCVRGETGLLQANRSIRFHPGASLTADLTWPNGAEAALFGTFAPEDVERFRGPQHCLIWGDEFAAWRKLDDAWDMMEFGLRLGPHPHMILTTTPKRRAKLREIMERPDTVVVRATTNDNPGLPADRRAALYARYGGTVLGRQELDAEIIEDVAGALWSRSRIGYRPEPRIEVAGVHRANLARVVVAIDPATTSGEDSDETGIIVAGLGHDARGYVLADLTARCGPIEWARIAIAALATYGGDRIVAESNQGGDMVRTVLAAVDPLAPISLVHASRGKRTRAEPIAALYEQGRISHVGPFPELEDQLCQYTGAPNEDSPDRLDALVWALSELFGVQLDGQSWGVGGKVWGSA
jgi:phage terminase large subunit-like protein